MEYDETDFELYCFSTMDKHLKTFPIFTSN